MQGMHVALIVAIIILIVAVPAAAIVFLLRFACRPRFDRKEAGTKRTDDRGC